VGTGTAVSDVDDSLVASVAIALTSAMPIREVACLSHSAEVWFEGRSTARILPRIDTGPGSARDVVVRYRLSREDLVSELFTFETPDGGLMFMLAEPPEPGPHALEESR
jgi:hypothetical protein